VVNLSVTLNCNSNRYSSCANLFIQHLLHKEKYTEIIMRNKPSQAVKHTTPVQEVYGKKKLKFSYL